MILEIELPMVTAWSPIELANQEKAAIGFFLSNHPMDDYKEILSSLKIINVADYVEIRAGDKITLAGIVTGLQIKYSKKGNRFCIFKLEDKSSSVKCLAWSEAYGKFSESLKDGELIIVDGRVESTEGQEVTLILEEVKKLADAVPLKARTLNINVKSKDFNEAYLEDLVTILNKNRGNCEVNFNFCLENEINEIKIKMQSPVVRIHGTSLLANKLEEKGCQVEWVL
jgi:DNA polymerase-3 subunit alpha